MKTTEGLAEEVTEEVISSSETTPEAQFSLPSSDFAPKPVPIRGRLFGGNALVVEVAKGFTFEASHRLENHRGACRNPHGHSYKLQVACEGRLNFYMGMVVDFGEISLAVEANIIGRADHALLCNKKPDDYVYKYWAIGCEVTAENLALLFFTILENSSIGQILKSVTLWETEKCYARVFKRGNTPRI